MMQLVKDIRTCDIRDAIDTVECHFEYMLDLARAGRESRRTVIEGRETRRRLVELEGAMQDIAAATPDLFRDASTGPFARRFLADLNVARTAVGMVLKCPSIHWAMIDNLSSLSTLQSFVNDLFFVDQVLLNSGH